MTTKTVILVAMLHESWTYESDDSKVFVFRAVYGYRLSKSNLKPVFILTRRLFKNLYLVYSWRNRQMESVCSLLSDEFTTSLIKIKTSDHSQRRISAFSGALFQSLNWAQNLHTVCNFNST